MSASTVIRVLIAVALTAFAAGAASADALKPGATNLGTGVAKGINPRVQVLKPGAAAKTLALPRQKAIAPDRICATSVQSTVRWDPYSNANWPATQLNLLCGGAPDTSEPCVCFDRVMSGVFDGGGWLYTQPLGCDTHSIKEIVAVRVGNHLHELMPLLLLRAQEAVEDLGPS